MEKERKKNTARNCIVHASHEMIDVCIAFISMGSPNLSLEILRGCWSRPMGLTISPISHYELELHSERVGAG